MFKSWEAAVTKNQGTGVSHAKEECKSDILMDYSCQQDTYQPATGVKVVSLFILYCHLKVFGRLLNWQTSMKMTGKRSTLKITKHCVSVLINLG